jgi:hypothetical protein
MTTRPWEEVIASGSGSRSDRRRRGLTARALIPAALAAALIVQAPYAAAGEGPGQESPGTPFPSLPPSFPPDSYTPHGYVDNPYHSMVFNRSGVIRSYPPLGMGWWRTDFPGAYGDGPRNYLNYVSLMQLSVQARGQVFCEERDFSDAGCELRSSYHTKHALSYDWSCGSLTAGALYFLPRERTLACLVTFTNTSSTQEEVLLHATHVYATGPQKWWGRDGMVSRYIPESGAAVAKVWAYGDVFAMAATASPVAHRGFDSTEAWEQWVRSGGKQSGGIASLRGRGPLYTTLSYALTIPPKSAATVLLCLSRGANEAEALTELRSGVQSAADSLARQLARDDRFWSGAPRLAGDWPGSWKRGWVYDFETLRMTVRPPLGIFRHPWDGMQVHSPRLVLGETALDMHALSYADPAVAREVILGTFADAPAPNVPCVREDGSVNMISSDGSECGTAPMWGYPFHVISSLYQSTRDSQWVQALYPRLAAYLEWWLAHRTDREGWLHCNNSWESGQDGSRRFLVAEGNEAAVADFVRTVDVEASMAQAMTVMSTLAGVAGHPEDRTRWNDLAARRIANTRSMYVDGWFRDWDARSGRPIILPDHVDVMMLAPLTCGVATSDQIRGVLPTVRATLKDKPGWLQWPPALQTFAEAAWNGGFQPEAAEVVARIADRVYARTDAREIRIVDSTDRFSYRIPGVANEFWPLRNPLAGGENYGWGATLPTHIIRTIMGLREYDDGRMVGFTVAPALPAQFRKPGMRLGLTGFRYLDRHFDVTYVPGAGDVYEVSIAPHREGAAAFDVVNRATGQVVARSSSGKPAAFSARAGDICIVVIR